MNLRLPFGLAALVVAVSAGVTFSACGGSSSSSQSGGDDGGADSTAGSGDGGLLPDVFNGDGGCGKLGAACSSGGDCCSGDCNNKVCDYPSCASDNGACASNGDCCSQTCTGGKCAPLNPACATLGNHCTTGADCCSKFCSNGTCQPSSFCGQPGDACSTSTDCCTGTCAKASGQTLGTCGAVPPGGPANCGLADGQLCGGSGPDGGVVFLDSGLPQCGGPCCSRACAPWGPTGVLVCQPASGCHVVGDLCTKDGDCCGSAGLPGGSSKPVTCVINPGDTLGVCRLPMGCKPNGDVCKLSTMTCNSSCDCCSGNCETMDTCKQDNVGVPRCTGAQCVNPGASCASSADCCNGAPCVPNPSGNPPYVCYQSACVPSCGACTNNADCCPGSSCIVAQGSTQGTCSGACGGSGSDGGISFGDGGSYTPPDGGCGLYGQICSTAADCCNGVPCTAGRCQVPVQ